LIHCRLELAGGGIVEIPAVTDGVENVGMLRAQEAGIDVFSAGSDLMADTSSARFL